MIIGLPDNLQAGPQQFMVDPRQYHPQTLGLQSLTMNSSQLGQMHLTGPHSFHHTAAYRIGNLRKDTPHQFSPDGTDGIALCFLAF
jgi:hypothetical protein